MKTNDENVGEDMTPTAYAQIYYKVGDVPYNSGKKMKIKLLSPRVGVLHNGVKVDFNSKDGIWRLMHDSRFAK